MPGDFKFQFGSIAVQLLTCEVKDRTLTALPACVPPSCTGNSTCFPPGRTLAMVSYRDLPDPAVDLMALLNVLERLELPAFILAGSAEMPAIEQALRPSSRA